MVAYTLRRLLGALIVMLAVATLVFFMLHLVPGDPVVAMLSDTGGPEEIAAMKHQLGLDQPLTVQFGWWVVHALNGDLGASIYGSHQPVTTIIAEAFPRTMVLSLLSFFIAMVIAVPAGILSATRRNTATDAGVSFLAFLGLAMPDFWVAILLIIVFAADLKWLPAIGYAPLSDGFWPWFSHLILPAISIGTAFSAVIARMIRSSLLEVLSSDYMRTARAKGLTPRMVMWGHAMPNAMIPVITVIGIAFALLISGAVVVENVFSIKGLGRVLIEGIINRDYPVVQGAILVVSAMFVLSNLIVDLLYGVIDPRIRLH